MVLHLVLFQFKEDGKAHLDEALARLKAMVGPVEVIVDLKAGKDFLHSGRSYDLGLAVTLADRKALERYNDHPAHQPVKQFLAPLYEKAVSVDFEY
jgi:hypothetical protein